MAAKIKKGDTVIVITGRDKGKEGEVLKVLPTESRIVVQGVNMVKRHQKASMQNTGGIVSKELSMHLSNVALKDPKTGKATRVGFKVTDGKKQRIAKRSGEVITA
jgi:large subunit ribosomal protein L24